MAGALGTGNRKLVVVHSRKIFLICLMFFIFALCSIEVFSDTPDPLLISRFGEMGLADWKEKSFKGKTSYKVLELDGEQVLQADSQRSASGIYKNIKIKLQEYPYLNWRWRIENKIDSKDERSKGGDDYAARIYVVIDGGLLFWKSMALSYVWANQAVKGSVWNNAYAGDSVKMLALRSSDDVTGTWYTEKRNVYEDLKKVFGKEISSIDSVAIMTDTDDSRTRTRSYYAEIFFSAN
jgi:hypothetical protein